MRPSTAPETRDLPGPVLWATIRRNWLVLIGATVLCTCIGGIYSARQTKIYRSTGMVEIAPTSPQPLGSEVKAVVDVGAGAYWTNREYLETQLRIILSRRVTEEAVRRLGLHRDLGFLENLPPKSPVRSIEVPVHVAAATLTQRASVDPLKNSRLVLVSIEDADPARAARVLNTLLEVYLEQNVQNALDAAQTASEWLGGQLVKLKSDLEQQELSLHAYKKDNDILSVSLEEQSNMLRVEMGQLNERLTTVRADVERISAKHAELSKLNLDDPSSLASSELLSSPGLQALRNEYITAYREKVAQLAFGKGENHPEVKSVHAREQASREALLSEVKTIREAVGRDLAVARREAEGLNRLYESARKRALDLNLLEIEYRRLERGKKNTEKLYTTVLERTGESDLTRLMRFNNLQIVERPLVSKTPVRPKMPISLAFGMAIGLVVGVAFVVGRELVDRTVSSPEHIEALGLSVLGVLPALASGGARTSSYAWKGSKRRVAKETANANSRPELIVHTDPRSGVAEAARVIRTNVRFMAPDKAYGVILVTSAAPSEGKTTMACCIAVAMAQAGQRILLMDCDLRRSRLHRVFGLDNDEGVTTAVVAESVRSAAVRQTEVPNLSVLPAGPHAPNPAEIVQSERFAELLAFLRESFDCIIIDSPPVVPVTDGAILATRVDATILVARASQSTRDLLRKAVRTLHAIGAPIAGCVLNALDVERQGRGYYQYYYYGKGQGYGETPPEPAATGV
jgi:capsular exopolysaccharide synthesis family protein